MELFWGPEMAGLEKSKSRLLGPPLPNFARCNPGQQHLEATVKRLSSSGQELPAKLVANVSTVSATASPGPLTLQGGLELMFGKLANFPWFGKLANFPCAVWAWAASGSSNRKHASLGALAP
eukprot:1156363-Pelagomonas_calceolata.AAC.6